MGLDDFSTSIVVLVEACCVVVSVCLDRHLGKHIRCWVIQCREKLMTGLVKKVYRGEQFHSS